MTNKAAKEKAELNIRVAANEFLAALEETIYLSVKAATDETGGGLRHEKSKKYFAAAAVMLWRAMNGDDPR
jgi:hypothetical protein